MNLCRTCGLDFISLSAFDQHRVGDHDYTFAEGIKREPPDYNGRRCLDISELQDIDWRQDRHGRWRSPVRETILERVSL